MNERNKLAAALTEHDRKESRKRGHNPYALGQYLARLAEIEADVAAGAAWRSAVIAAFSGRLQDACLRAIGATASTIHEERAQPVAYTPVSSRQTT